MKKADARHGEVISICPAEAVVSAERLKPERFKLMVPAHWKSERAIHERAQQIEEATLEWFGELGFSAEQLLKVRSFRPSHYVGIPFPSIGDKEALLMSKYLSLWLLWDDVDVESGAQAWKLSARHVLSGEAPPGSTRFDRAWLELLMELSERMSGAWIEALCETMSTWSDAALLEARMSRQWRAGDARVSFAESLQSRIDTIGMYSMAYLVEYVHGFELPARFHEHRAVKGMKTLSNTIVGLGNDIFSAGKDYASGYINVFFTLMNELDISLTDAIACVVRMHNDAMVAFDGLAESLPSLGPQWDPRITQWTQTLRSCSLGFSVWESKAPRYSRFKLVVNGQVVEPSFTYYHPEHIRRRRAAPAEFVELAAG